MIVSAACRLVPTNRISPPDEVIRLKNLVAREQSPHGLLEVDDVNQVPLAVDVRLHLRVPAAGPVAKVHAGVDQVFDDKSHEQPPRNAFLNSGRDSAGDLPTAALLENRFLIRTQDLSVSARPCGVKPQSWHEEGPKSQSRSGGVHRGRFGPLKGRLASRRNLSVTRNPSSRSDGHRLLSITSLLRRLRERSARRAARPRVWPPRSGARDRD